MKTLYTILLVLGASFTYSFGQTFTWDTNDTIETNLDQNATVQLPMYQSAVGNDTVTLAITVIHNDLPSSWDGMLCIYGSCLGTIPVSGTQATMNPISGSNQGMVRLTVNPLNGTEVAKLQVYVYDVDYPNDGDTATWLLNTTLSVEEKVEWEDFSLHPNPITSTVQLKTDTNIDYVEIYALNGELIARFEEDLISEIDLSDLETGSYLLKAAQSGGLYTIRKIQKL